ncbi:hypothetical protein CCR75_001128 [Bremia lactucae]|uniref:Uncharacterized protein n=1 Tax=Bremia lactucae TaxID=4779 RepID=A0A976ILF0_BRELC|nr:hypothetical protein CCR75_001128 [Bremia lactucae]
MTIHAQAELQLMHAFLTAFIESYIFKLKTDISKERANIRSSNYNYSDVFQAHQSRTVLQPLQAEQRNINDTLAQQLRKFEKKTNCRGSKRSSRDFEKVAQKRSQTPASLSAEAFSVNACMSAIKLNETIVGILIAHCRSHPRFVLILGLLFIQSNGIPSIFANTQMSVLDNMQPIMTRYVRLLGARGLSNHAKSHVHMPETAMLSNNGTHRFERKGWEYSAYMGMLGGPIVLYLGLNNVPETDSDVFAREEALKKRTE